MSELIDFLYFQQNTLHSVDFNTGKIDIQLSIKYNCSRTAIMGIRHKRRHKNIADYYF